MKIIKFIDGIWIPPLDGASERFYQITRNLSQIGVDVVVIHCNRQWSDLSLISQQGYATYAIPRNYYYDDLSLVSEIINKEKPDVIEMNDLELINSVGVSLGKLFNIPIVFDMQYVLSTLLKDLKVKKTYKEKILSLEKRLPGIVSGVICFTKEDQSDLIKASGLDKNRTRIIPLGSDCKNVQERKINYDDKDILFLGNLYYEPNLLALRRIIEFIAPKVIEKHPGVRFKFVGDCPKEISHKYQNSSLIFTGRILDVNKIFEGIRVCIAPIDIGGGMRVKVLTYMASGVPIVASDIAVSAITHQDSILIANDITGFSQKINLLLNNLNESRRLAKLARTICERDFGWENISKQCLSLYQEVTRNSVCPIVKARKIKYQPFWLNEIITKGRFKDFKVDKSKYYYIKGGSVKEYVTRDNSI
jgi:polysaccharide biosynthesis protein PslH